MNDTVKREHLDSLLKNEKADYTILIDESSLKTAAAGAERYGISLQETTPTLIIKVDGAYIAAIICGNNRISFKKLKQALQAKDVRMADPQEIFNITGAHIGEISLVNQGLKTVIDSNVLKNKNCYGGCGISMTTLRINTDDLVRITNAQILDFAEIRS